MESSFKSAKEQKMEIFVKIVKEYFNKTHLVDVVNGGVEKLEKYLTKKLNSNEKVIYRSLMNCVDGYLNRLILEKIKY